MATYTQLSPFKGNIGFNAHHSPMGAFFSFTCGHPNTPGGLAAQSGRPGTQDIFIGVKDGDRKAATSLRCLPFFAGAADASAQAFLVGQGNKAGSKPKLTAYALSDIQRFYGWASDRWVTSDFQFTIYTPFGEIPDPANASTQALRETLLPAVIAEFTVDNTQGKQTKTAVFALRFADPGARPITDLGPSRVGFGLRRHLGVAGEMLDSLEPAFTICRWGPDEALSSEVPFHLLSSCPGVAFEVPAGHKRTLRLALGCYLEGTVTTNLEGSYYYTRCFAGLNDVLGTALDNYNMMVVRSAERDHELAVSSLSPDQQFLLAHATRSYYGSTQLLSIGGKPFWIVNEGEYCMLNTLDLSVDHVFWELRENPWVVRNLLENFVKFYSFRDYVKIPDAKNKKKFKTAPAGISFCHDMGVNNNFSPLGTSSYELAELDALCFSHMTQEQVCNWTLMAGCYVAATDDMDWLNQYAPVIRDCYLSMLARDHVDESKRTGVMQLDSYRCGEKGSEITTYDSLDHSLAQSRNNLYIATKCWATYLSLATLFQKLGKTKLVDECLQSASLAAKTVASQMGKDGFIPAVFEKGNAGHGSRILPAIEGLIYPLYWKQFGSQIATDALDPKGGFAEMLSALKKHTQTLLSDKKNRNRFPDGGIRLSSTSGNSWMSKIALTQHVCREYFGMEKSDAKQRAADAAHVKWQVEGDSAYWAMSDQIVDGVAKGSKYYPRCVTTVLWMK